MRYSVRPAHGLLLVALLAPLVPVLSALALDRLGGTLTPASTAGAAALGGLAAGIGLSMAWRRGFRLRWSRLNAAELAVLAAALLGSFAYLLWLAGRPFLPVGTSVDGGWHYSLADHITQVRRLGVTEMRLSDVDSYTPGYHLLAVVLGQWLRAEPIYTIYPACAALLALAIGATVQMAMDAVPPGAWRPLAGVAALALLALLPNATTLDIITGQNFYPTAAGMAYLLAAGWAAGLRHRSGLRVAWFPLGLALLGIIVCYPFWLPIALALVVALSIARNWRSWRSLGVDLGLLAGTTGLGLLLVHDLMSDQLRQISNRMPAVSPMALAALAVIAIGGLIVCRFLGRQRALPLAILGALSLAQVIILGGKASYVGQKLLYGLPYTTVALGMAAFGLAIQLARRPIARHALTVALVLGVAGALAAGRERLDQLGRRPFHPLSPDQVDLALWVRDQVRPDPDAVDYVVDYSITAYWIKVGLLRSPHGWSAASVLEYAPPRYDHWATDPATPPFAFVDNAEPPRPGGNPGAPGHELARRGAARFLERADSPADAQVQIKVYTTPERFGAAETIRTAAFVSALPGADYRLWFLLTPAAEGDSPPPPLWRQPLDTQASTSGAAAQGAAGGARYGMVRVDPQVPTVSVWDGGKPAAVAVPPLTAGTTVSGWMQLTYKDQPIATRRIYDLTIGDAGSLRLRDFNPTSMFVWAPQPSAAQATPTRAADAELGGQLAIKGWELEGGLRAGATGALVLEWRCLAAPPPPARLFVHLLGSDGASYPVYDGEPHGGAYPFWLWRPGEVVRDRYELNLPASIPAGSYELVVGVYNPATGQAWPVSAGAATPREPAALLATVEVGGSQ